MHGENTQGSSWKKRAREIAAFRLIFYSHLHEIIKNELCYNIGCDESIFIKFRLDRRRTLFW
jgi:hypothetical protein